MMALLWVAAGSALGAVLRLGAGLAVAPADLPWDTLIVNASGSFVIGVIATPAVAGGRWLASEQGRLFMMTGVLGGYTTFSVLSLETWVLAESGQPWLAGLNMGANMLLSLLAVVAGYALAARHTGRWKSHR